MSQIVDSAAYEAAKAKAEQTRNQAAPAGKSIQDLDLDVFLDLMLTELQQQDPLDPMDNQEMLNTINQIRQISSSDKLSSTLDSVLLGQNVSTAAGLIGKQIDGLTDSGQLVSGIVQQVAINDGAPLLNVAVETSARAGRQEGEIADGSYEYVVTWETEDGTFGVQASVDTDDFGDDFKGSINLQNLPQLKADVTRKVYRTDGSGNARLVGTMPNGTATGFTDTVSNANLGAETLPTGVSVFPYADSVSVKLSNVSNIDSVN